MNRPLDLLPAQACSLPAVAATKRRYTYTMVGNAANVTQANGSAC